MIIVELSVMKPLDSCLLKNLGRLSTILHQLLTEATRESSKENIVMN